MSRWRPIRTAPRNKLILLAQPPVDHAQVPWIVMPGRWIEVPHMNAISMSMTNSQPVEKEEPHWQASYLPLLDVGGAYNGKVYEPRSMLFYPTHWMPLPEHPQLRKRKRRR